MKTITALLLTFSCANGLAATIYNDRNNWLNATVAPIVTESFDNQILDATMITFDGGITATGSNPMGANQDNGVFNAQWEFRIYNPGADNGFASITVTFPLPVMAFGIDINSISSSRGAKISGDWDGNGDQVTDLWTHHGATSNGFFGVVGNQPFTEFTIFAADGSTVGNDFITADDLSYEDLDLIFTDGFE